MQVLRAEEIEQVSGGLRWWFGEQSDNVRFVDLNGQEYMHMGVMNVWIPDNGRIFFN